MEQNSGWSVTRAGSVNTREFHSQPKAFEISEGDKGFILHKSSNELFHAAKKDTTCESSGTLIILCSITVDRVKIYSFMAHDPGREEETDELEMIFER